MYYYISMYNANFTNYKKYTKLYKSSLVYLI